MQNSILHNLLLLADKLIISWQFVLRKHKCKTDRRIGIMRLTLGKIVIIPIFVAIAATLAGLVAFTEWEGEAIDLSFSVTLENVKMKKIDDDNPDLMIVQADLSVFNETERILTVSRISYDLYANEILVGRGSLSFADIPLSGRAPLFSGSSTTFPSEMQLRKSPEVMEIWDKLSNNDTVDITWRAEGVAQIETAFSIIEKDFNSTL